MLTADTRPMFAREAHVRQRLLHAVAEALRRSGRNTKSTWMLRRLGREPNSFNVRLIR